jgi:transglutaminase-like putative cysteine protease
MNKYKHLIAPFSVFFILILAFAVSSSFREKPPRITEVTPGIARPGDLIEIRGNNFGKEQLGSEVFITGIRPLSSNYVTWSNTSIVLEVPQEITSGDLYVKTALGTSESVLFTNSDIIPKVTDQNTTGKPEISSIEPDRGSPGTLITIRGFNFGNSPSNFYFTSIAGAEAPVKASILDFEIKSWSDEEVELYVPDDASTGNIWIENDRGESNQLFFTVQGRSGTREYSEPVFYRIQQRVHISDIKGSEKNRFDLWLSEPEESLAVRIAEINRQNFNDALSYPYIGFTRYHFEDLNEWGLYRIEHQYLLEAYKVTNTVNLSSVARDYNQDRKLFKEYTKAEDFIPKDDPQIQRILGSSISRNSNPYLYAQNIYRYLLSNLKTSTAKGPQDVLEALEAGSGNSFVYAHLFTTFTRAAGIPSRVVHGLLMDDAQRGVIHFWAEFYLEGFGWLPVDAALADGMRFGNYPNVDNIQNAFFGQQDNRHIPFVKGTRTVIQSNPKANLSFRDPNYSRQTIWEEYEGISTYNAQWFDLIIIEYYD